MFESISSSDFQNECIEFFRYSPSKYETYFEILSEFNRSLFDRDVHYQNRINCQISKSIKDEFDSEESLNYNAFDCFDLTTKINLDYYSEIEEQKIKNFNVESIVKKGKESNEDKLPGSEYEEKGEKANGKNMGKTVCCFDIETVQYSREKSPMNSSAGKQRKNAKRNKKPTSDSKKIEHFIRRFRTSIHRKLVSYCNSRLEKTSKRFRKISSNMTQKTTYELIKEWNWKKLRFILCYENEHNEKLIENLRVKEENRSLIDMIDEMSLGEFVEEYYYGSKENRDFIIENKEAADIFERKNEFSLSEKGGNEKYFKNNWVFKVIKIN